MRVWLTAHLHTAATFVAMLMVALIVGTTIGASAGGGPSVASVPAPPIALPALADDRDRDTYADAVDLVDGDAHVRISLERLATADILPYFVIGTQDDHWRMGAGRELEWRHVVDPDALGYDVGSPGWTKHALRTGAWWYALPMEGQDKIIATTGTLGPEAPAGVEWPQVFHVNIREDAPEVTVRIELMDARPDPDRIIGAWDIVVEVPSGDWRDGEARYGNNATGTLRKDGTQLDLRISVHGGIDGATQQIMAERWAPELRFSAEERFFPTSGEALARFHGFGRRGPDDHDLRSWTRSFTNGRDGYVLLLADFTGDGIVDHHDAQAMTDILREGGVAPDTVYAHVFDTTGDRVVVQYWFIYIYNFVEDESGDGIEALAHKGDREFVQLTFASREDVLNGTPESIAYSQHYRGIKIPNPSLMAGPFGDNSTHMLVYPARGSHASYPEAGDDRRFRPALAGYSDIFLGDGEHWPPGSYTLERFEAQAWTYGWLWGPPTRHSRDLGTSSKPFLQYAFRYPFIDPLSWEARLPQLQQDDLVSWYGGSP